MMSEVHVGTEIINIAAYRFVELDQLEQRRQRLREVVDRCRLKGTILLSPEGINLFVAGRRPDVAQFLDELKADAPFSDIEVKESVSEYQPFNRMLIKIKKEIISFGVATVDPIHRPSRKLPARQLQQWLKEGRRVHLLDTRNRYEIEVGTFQNALNPQIDSFREFPDAVQRLPEHLKDEPIVMFCTGGIRCEKAGPFMEQAGFRQVFQLEGGILKYFEECGGDFYEGDCFVFDQRVAVDPQLNETPHQQCFVCQEVVSPEAQRSEHYVPGVSCPRCYREPRQQMEERLAERHQRLREIVQPLPGSVPYFNCRPLNVPQRFDGLPLIDFLCRWHPQIARAEWLRRIADGEIIPGRRYGRRRKRMPSPEEKIPLSPDRIVRGGERFENLQPGTTEPDVDADLQIVFEDDQFIVINKPAPLPLHPSGRYNRNTVQFILDELYRPCHPLPVHRLDANTSGVVLLCRKRSVARVVQRQFEQRTVEKIYLARVYGHPPQDTFVCDQAIAGKPGPSGIRLPDADGQAAVTEFHVVQRFDDGTSLLRVRPLTGRTNQIRIHLWHLGWPIVGDPTWLPDGRLGSNSTLPYPGPVMCLHASRLRVHDQNGELRDFSVPDPAWAAADQLPQTV